MPTFKPRYMLIDGNALVHRGFHAIPGLATKTGQPTGAVFGFTAILLRAIKDLKPTHIACTFDLSAPTFRHEQYKDYKATRVKAAPELYEQIPVVKDVVRSFHIPIFEKEGFEADDCLGTLARELYQKHEGKCEIMIVTGDLDTLQLVNHSIKVYTLRKGITDIAVYDAEAVKVRYGLTPEQMIDFKALRGDPSDNIKGVKGIGEKGAIKLIQDFGSLNNLYQAIHHNNDNGKIKEKIFQLLKNQEAEARQSYELSKIITNVPLQIAIPEFVFSVEILESVTQEFQKLEFQSLMNKLPKVGTYQHSIDSQDLSPSTPAQLPKNYKPKAANYHLINTQVELQSLLEKLPQASLLALDTETNSLDAIRAKLVGLSFSFKAGEAYYIPAQTVRENLQELKTILENPKIKKLGHNLKYDYLALQNIGINLEGVYDDTMIESFLLDAGTRQHNLNALAFNELGYQMQPIEDLIGKGSKQITMDQVPVEKVCFYAAEDADITFCIHHVLEPRIQEQGLTQVYRNIEMPLLPVLAHMERLGIKLDSKLLAEAEIDLNKQLYALEKAIYKEAGEEFNINSPKQLKEILFTKLELPTLENKKTKTGLSTAAAELEKMFDLHPIIPKILEYRELYKLQSTYITALPEMVNPDTKRIHTSYNQTIAATGRLSSTDPNLQNIPVKSNRHGVDVRQAFVAERGYSFLSLDYSQIELRIVAHLSQDENMLKVFQEGHDIHTNTAISIFNVAKDKVTKEMRRDAKTINFGILYGLSSFGLSYRINELSRADAKDFIDKYFSAYPGVKVYIEKVKEEVRKNGFVRNQLGRIRRFPEIRSSVFAVRGAAERAAFNFPIQSLAADIIKIAMINIHQMLSSSASPLSSSASPLSSSAKAEDPLPSLQTNSHILQADCRMLLQVHDELLFEVKEERVEHYIKIIKPLMENAIKLSVPVTVEAKVGSNWGEMEDKKSKF